MPVYSWDPKKNEELKGEGRPSFEHAVEDLLKGVIFDVDNPGHPGQRLYVVKIAGYPHAVPYEIRGEVTWLITVYPTRKYKR